MLNTTPFIESFLKWRWSFRSFQLQHWLFDSSDQLACFHYIQQLSWSFLLQVFLKYVKEPVVKNRQGNG